MHLDLDASELEHSSAHIEWAIGPTRADALQWDRIRFDADLPVNPIAGLGVFLATIGGSPEERRRSIRGCSIGWRSDGGCHPASTHQRSMEGRSETLRRRFLGGEPLHLEGMFLRHPKNSLNGSFLASLQAGPMQWEKAYSMALDQLNTTVELVWDPGNWRDGKLHCKWSMDELITPWVSLREGTVSVDVEPHVNPPQPEEMQDWAWWAYLAPYQIQVESQLEGLEGELLEAQSLASRLRWQAPNLQMEKLSGALYEGGMDLKADHVPVV